MSFFDTIKTLNYTSASAKGCLSAQIMRLVKLFLWVSVFIVVLFFAFYKLGVASLDNADEGIYAEVSLEMFENRQFFTPTYFGTVWLEKPPLHLWLNVLSFHIFGTTPFAVRFWPALFLVGNMLLIFFLGRLIYGDKSGLLAIILFLTSQLFFTEHIGRTGDFDMGLIFFTLLAVYSYLQSKNKTQSHWYIICGLALSLGFFIKSIHIFPIYLAITLDWAITSRRWDLLKNIMMAFLISFAADALWVIPTYLTHQQAFIKQFLQGQIGDRLALDFGNHVRPWWWYFSFLNWSLAPFFYAAFFSLLNALRNFKQEGILFLWSSITLALFSLVSSKMHWHILPAIIPLYLILSHQFLQLPKSSFFQNILFAIALLLGLLPNVQTNAGYSFKEIFSFLAISSALATCVLIFIILLKNNYKKSKVLLVSIIIAIPAIGIATNMKRVGHDHFSPQPSALDQIVQNYSNEPLYVYSLPLNDNHLEPADNFYFRKHKITPVIISTLDELPTGQTLLIPRMGMEALDKTFLVLTSNDKFVVVQRI